MAVVGKLHGIVRILAPVMALLLSTAVGAADSLKDTGGAPSRQAIELYKSISRNLAAQQDGTARRRQDGQGEATSGELRPLATPPNDDFADAIALQGESGSVTGDNIDATSEPGEPIHAGVAGISSVWYTFTPQQDGLLTLDTLGFGTDFDTVIAVYTGTAVDGLSDDTIASNDDAAGTLQSQVVFPAEAGITYRIAIDGFDGAQGNFVLNFEQADRLAPANDDFDDAIALQGRSGSVTGDNLGATSEAGEPNHADAIFDVGSSVWYTFTPAQTGLLAFDTSGSAFDTVLAVYTGTAVDRLTEVASNDDDALGTLQSAVIFPVQAGTTYRIAVDGFAGAQGAFTLNFVRTDQGPSPNDDFDDAIALDGRRTSVTGNNIFATVVPGGEPAHAFFGGFSSVWYTFTPRRSGVTSVAVTSTTFFPLVAVYQGDSVSTLTDVASGFVVFSKGADAANTASVAFFARRGVTYRIAVDTDIFSLPPGAVDAEGLFTLELRRTNRSAPPNDDFEDPIALEGRSGTVTGNTRRATGEPFEPLLAFPGGTRSVWYTFTPSRTGVAFFDTFGSGFDTVLNVFTGDDLVLLTPVASNDDTVSEDDLGQGFQSQVAFLAERGVTYRIAVDGFGGDRGRFTLAFRQTSRRSPANDLFANAARLSGPSGSDSGFNVNSGTEAGEPNHAGVAGPASSVWWRWQAPFTGDVTFTTAGSNFDTVLAVYTGAEVSDLFEIASNDDAALADGSGILESLVTFPAEEGQVYRIAVDGFDGQQGSISLAFARGDAQLKVGTVSKGVTPGR